MKKLLILGTIFFGLNTFGQTDTTENGDSDTTRLKFKEVKILIIHEGKEKYADTLKVENHEKETSKKKTKTNDFIHWSGFNLFLNGYHLYGAPSENAANYRELAWERSIGYEINFLEKGVPIIKNHFILATGLGVQRVHYAFNRDTTNWPRPSQGFDIYSHPTSFVNTELKESINIWYLQVPLLMQFNTGKNPEKSFHLAAGIVGGLKFAANIKTQADDWKLKQSFDDVNPFSANATVRAGFGNFTVFANYGLLKLNRRFFVLSADKTLLDPGLHSFSAGITLIGW